MSIAVMAEGRADDPKSALVPEPPIRYRGAGVVSRVISEPTIKSGLDRLRAHYINRFHASLHLVARSGKEERFQLEERVVRF